MGAAYAKEKDSYSTDMAVMAGMLEAMDFHIGRYINYLKEKGLYDNTIFVITSDNGPDGGNIKGNIVMRKWQEKHGFHYDKDRAGERGYFGALGPEFAFALASPFSFFKYYTGEGGVRTPLILSGKNIPSGQRTNAFCFITDIVPTVLELVGKEPRSNKLYAPITGKSLLPHIQDSSIPVYNKNEGVGLEVANSSAYYLDEYKIVKNNIPLGDNKWYMYNLKIDPGETKDLAKVFPEKFKELMRAYTEYAKSVGVIEMEKGYSAEGEVGRKSMLKILSNNAIYILGIPVLIIGLFWLWKKRRKTKS